MTGTEEKKIKALARQYRKQGFDVFANLPGFPVPEEYGRYTPDLVAKKGNEVILVEVVSTSGDFVRKDAVAELARFANSQKNVRFDLVVVRSETRNRPTSTTVLKRLRGKIMKELQITSEIQPHVFPLLYSLAVEDLLVAAAAKKGVALNGKDTLPELAEYLKERNVITPAIVDFAKDAWDMRDMVLHQRESSINKQDIVEMLEKFKRLVKDYGWSHDSKRATS